MTSFLNSTSSAKSTDSFIPTLDLIKSNFKIGNVIEWGSGHSTEWFIKNKINVTSVESDKDYLNMVKRKFNVEGAHFVFENDTRYYPFVNGDYIPYDLALVDGRLRNKCMSHARLIVKHVGFVVLHDAEREEYQEGVSLFAHCVYTDNGNTAILTESDESFTKITKLLSTHTI